MPVLRPAVHGTAVQSLNVRFPVRVEGSCKRPSRYRSRYSWNHGGRNRLRAQQITDAGQRTIDPFPVVIAASSPTGRVRVRGLRWESWLRKELLRALETLPRPRESDGE